METKTVLQTNSGSFEKDVLHSDVPAAVDFYADWCGPCRIVSPVVEQLAGEYQGKMRFFKLNTDDNSDIAERYGVMGIPTIAFFKDGKEIDRIIGAAPKEQYRKQIDRVLGKA
jgi:thioredoxin 1